MFQQLSSWDTHRETQFVIDCNSSKIKTHWIYRICHTNQERFPVIQIRIIPRTRRKDVENSAGLQNLMPSS
jgi:hypothetical protein